MTASIVRVAVPMAALGYALAVVVTAHGELTGITSYAQVGPWFDLLDHAAGLSLIGVGVYGWFGWPRSSIGLLAMLAGVAWFGPDWQGADGVPDAVRSVGYVTAPFMLPLIADLVLTATGDREHARRDRRVLVLVYALIAALTVGRALTYVPFDERYCWATCSTTGNIFVAGGGDADIARSLTSTWLVLSSFGWAGLTLWSGRCLGHPSRIVRPGRRAVLLAAMALGVCTAAYGASLIILQDEWPRPTGPYTDTFQELFLARAAAMLAMAAGLAWMVAAEHRRSAALRDVTAQMAAAPTVGSLRATLSRALGDDTLELMFPLDDSGQCVDAAGTETHGAVAAPGRAVTPIERGGKPIAFVIHDAGLDSRVLEQEIGSAARLAVDNERLRAVVLAQLRELRSSRARIVEVGDTERQRLERDLHDGAQQRLLAMSYEVRLAGSAAHRAGMTELVERLAGASALAQRSIDGLRALAHGIYPAALAEAGLGPALASLSDEAALPIQIETTVTGRMPAAVEIAAYQAVSDALNAATRRGASYLRVRLAREDDILRLRVTDDSTSPMVPLTRAADRVGAAGGTLTTTTTDGLAGYSLIAVELPCG